MWLERLPAVGHPELDPLPPWVVEILPVYRSYRYFVLADNRIVIVEPDTDEIEYILVV